MKEKTLTYMEPKIFENRFEKKTISEKDAIAQVREAAEEFMEYELCPRKEYTDKELLEIFMTVHEAFYED
jgi:hypothetical protein